MSGDEGRQQSQDAVIERMRRMLGYVPVGTRDLLNVLAHPDCIAATRAFLDATDDASGVTP